ncbi:Protein alcS [Lachnellula occidentalis]|uniref:Protein alcS n=1 Tax=Lachnellula occidentalis TaxID=215460 RepID=A0A8H8UK62_9HELO|nr:Protein alcS [Lachnellula occidentalis]
MSKNTSIKQWKNDLSDGSSEHWEQRYSSQAKSSAGITMSPELFEKLYLPREAAPSDFRKRFANPAPLGSMGSVISGMTFAVILMEWGGATTLVGVAGIFYFTGPVLLLLAAIFEWAMGNFFSMMVMAMFGVFYLSFGVLETPSLGIAASYSKTGNMAEGTASVGYNAAIALYLMVWGCWLFTMWIFTLRTNTVSAVMFLLSFISCFVLGASYWKVSTGDHSMAIKLQKAGAGMFFAVALLGYYMTVAMIAAELQIPLKLPVGDLSYLWPKSDVESAELEKAE